MMMMIIIIMTKFSRIKNTGATINIHKFPSIKT